MIEMDALARERSQITGEAFEDWMKVIEWAAECESILELTDGEFVTLVKNSSSVHHYRDVVEFLEAHKTEAKLDRTGFDLLVEFADESSFGLTDWMKALNTFRQWTSANKAEATLERALGYIQCCSQELKTTGGDLSATVKSHLDSEGLQKV